MTLINNLESNYDAITTISGDIDATDYSGMTALHYAAKQGNKQIVDLLLDAGADPNIKTFSGKGYQDFLETETQSPQKEDEYSERERIAREYAEKIKSDKYYDFSYQQRELEKLNEINNRISLIESQKKESTGDEATDKCIEEIEEDSYQYDEVDWDNVDYARVTRVMLEKKKAIEVSLSGRALPFITELLVRIGEVNENWAAAALSKLQCTLFHSTMMDSAWDPRVMWNGSVLIRNGHRVMGLSYEDTMLLSEKDRNDLYEDIRKLRDQVWMVSVKDGDLQSITDPNDFNLNGNNIAGIQDLDAVENTSILTKKLLESVVQDYRGGVAFRVFSDGIHFYSVSRHEDELDFALDYLAILNEDIEEEPIESVSCSRTVSSIWPDGSGDEDNRGASKREYEYLDEVFSNVFINCWEELENELASKADKIHVKLFANQNLYDLVVRNVHSTMYKKVQRQFIWEPEIFADSEDRIRGYVGAYHLDDSFRRLGTPILIYFFIHFKELGDFDTLIEDLLQSEEINDVFIKCGLSTLEDSIRNGNMVVEVNIPKSDEEIGEWVSLEGNLEKAQTRLKELSKSEDYDDFDDFIDVFNDNLSSRFLRARLTLPPRRMLKLVDFGKELSSVLNDIEEESVLSSTIELGLPTMGIEQTFAAGDLDSGNM